jgi:hypothetical protein
VHDTKSFTKRHSTQKSPKGAAGQAQQVHDIKSFTKRYSVQKSPKGAAGQAQQVHNTKSFTKRHSAQKSPKGVAGQTQQVHDTKSFTKRQTPCKSRLRVQLDKHNKCMTRSLSHKGKSMQKSPKGATGQLQHHTGKGVTLQYKSHITYTQRRATRPTAQINAIAFSPPSLLRAGGGQRFHLLPHDK